MEVLYKYPLQWPPGVQRFQDGYRERSRFDTPHSRAVKNLIREVRLLPATNLIISSDVEYYERGGRQLPYANQKVEDPGVAVYFTYRGDTQCIAIDLFDRLKDNIQAIAKSIGALRGLERWGGVQMVNAAFKGFKALPAAGESLAVTKPWHEVLGVNPAAHRDIRRAAYRALARKRHPDAGGTSEEWEELRIAAEQGGVLSTA